MTDKAIPYLARIYARTLHGAALDAGVLDDVGPALVTLQAVLVDAPDWIKLLANPSIPLDRRRAFLKQTAKSLRLPEVVEHWLGLQIDRDRLELLDRMIAAYDDVRRQELNQHVIIVETAWEIDTKERKSIELALGTDTEMFDNQNQDFSSTRCARSLSFQWLHQPDLLSGMRIRIDQRVYDQSLAGDLNSLHRWLNQV